MALFPAFSEAAKNKVDDSSKELDWLNNKSFQTGDAISLHSRFIEKTSEKPNKRESSVGRAVCSAEEEEKGGGDVLPRKKKKKSEKKRKKKKKHKKKSGRDSSSSGSDSDTVYPSDLKKEEEEVRQQATSLASRFSWLDDLQSPTDRPFCVDRKPDQANWTYKSLYRGDIARYRRKGVSSLGLDSRRQGVNWDDSETKKKHKGGDSKKAADRYYSTASRQLLRSEPPVPVLPPDSSDAFKLTPFLPLDDAADNKGQESGDRVQTSSVNPLGVYDSSTALWLQGRGKQDDQKVDLETEGTSAHAVGRTEEFNKRLREQPTDTQLWIQFIHYQDEVSAAAFEGEEEQQGSDSAERRKSSCRAILEKKLSIAERALASNPTCTDLQLERLKICQELWEPSALAKEWKKLVFLHPNSAPLWRKYLLFTQSSFSSFTVTKVNSAYGKCLSTLSAVRDGSMLSHPAPPGIEEDMLDILAQQCHFLRQAGQCEKAISLFQAMMDFTFFKPDSVKNLSTKQQVEFFEPFWDSGEARVGEVGAKGWKAWMVQQERGGWIQPCAEEDEEDEEEEEEEVKDRSLPRATVWLDVESSREAAHWLPWRPDKAKGQSEEDCEDPDRQVLFDDIGPSLICLSSPELQLRLLLHFLSFLGLPVPSALSSGPGQPGLLLEDLSLLTQGDLQHPLTSFDLPDPGVNSVGHMTTLKGTRKWAGLGRQGERFLTNVFNVTQPVLPPHHRAVLSLSWIQYEKLKVLRCLRSGNKKRLRSQGKSSKRVAKRLLKEPDNRSSLVLWREYAHLEWMLRNLDEARKVFSTATAMGGTKGPSSPNLCELCLLWAQLEVENGAKEHAGRLPDVTTSPAVCVLVRLAEGTSYSSSSPSVSPVSILKARRSYEQALTDSLSALDQNIQALQSDNKGSQEEKLRLTGLVGCYALFQHLTVSIHAASAVYSQAREKMEELHHKLTPKRQPNGVETAKPVGVEASPSAADSGRANRSCVSRLASEREVLSVQQAALLRFHSSTSVFPLASLRQALTSALSACPNSAPLWSIYVQVENRYHSAGRARRFFHAVTRDSSSVIPRLFAIVAEQQRKQLVDAAQRSCCFDKPLPVLPENGLSNRIRGLFESAIATETGAHCSLLWRMYIYFLVSEGKMDKARGIFYKALQNIPWAKGLYMDAAQLFPEHLQEFVDLMTEKELRLRLPLEELDILLED
ncbi:nuclear exosome regulator NRDE2 [Kryptolebias marmoratus]|uniref:NRDE-2, necessary for RNA interference, domain containing n=1 Tax=Kryptolebias marmoratus TaxID=37003 RepID=A0A3Q3FDV3_KRYMA|nr:nuclear exosome regulator NRDE2 [Kryptolebias marmoratus]